MSDCRCNNWFRHDEARSSRRQFLARCGMGIGSLGLASLLTEEVLAAIPRGTAKTTHFPAKAKHVIHIFAAGAPSQVDTWDPKPALTKANGQSLPGLRTAWRWRRRSSSPDTANRASRSARCFPRSRSTWTTWRSSARCRPTFRRTTSRSCS